MLHGCDPSRSCNGTRHVNWMRIGEHEVEADHVALSGRRARHMLDVLGVTPGQRVRVVVENRSRGEGVVIEAGRDTVVLRYEPGAAAPRPRTLLVLAPPRPKVMRRLWIHLPGLDVSHVLLVRPRGTPAEYFATHWLQAEVYREQLGEGIEQSGTPWMPEVTVTQEFERALHERLPDPKDGGARLIAHPHANRTLLEATRSLGCGTRVLAIGPERGWTERELEIFGELGFEPVSLGACPLRTDAACIAALAVLAMS
jgi:16S rRNA (uracil1498-N3)-methyltransferase